MATKFSCDRCDSIWENSEDIGTVSIPVNQVAVSIENWPRKNFDLCNRCLRVLNDFMKPLAKEMKS